MRKTYFRIWLGFLAILFMTNISNAQVSKGGLPPSFSVDKQETTEVAATTPVKLMTKGTSMTAGDFSILAEPALVNLPKPDMTKILAEDAELLEKGGTF